MIFVSHCLLNENVRYLGGACTPGAVGPLLAEWQAKGYGICQMPCPEQRVWGGVLKPYIAWGFGAERRRLWLFHVPLLWVFTWYTKVRYRLLARHVADEVRDYRRSGYEVDAVVGVAGSPSCGITTTLDTRRWLEAVARYRPDEVTRESVNRDAVIASAVPGEGWFMSALFRRLHRHDRSIQRIEHDLVGELTSVGRP